LTFFDRKALANKLKQKITLIGSTGLIGSHFLKEISFDDCQSLTAISRRIIYNLENKSFIKQSIYDFSDLEKMRTDLKTDVLVCALGSTIKKAGSKDAFVKIDHDLNIQISKIAKEEGCRSMILVSSIGANSMANIFYSRVKGLVEESLEDIGFEELHILRPSLLLGERIENRPAEKISKLFINPLSFMIPMKYRPIHANYIAKKIIFLIRKKITGKHIWEGINLFENKNISLQQNIIF
tara:strand:- start:510 stop:1226 length:717 start_codon:yes stop_codon:yes gene_type:complete